MPNNQSENRLVTRLRKLNLPSHKLSDCCMYRVHNELRELKEKAYEPVLVSIGPYHRADEKLHMMEEYKLRYLNKVIQRENAIPKENDKLLVDYLSTMRSLVKEARNCYVEHVELDRLDEEQFAEMLLLDSCFIVEVIREYHIGKPEAWSIRALDWMATAVQRDLMLFENQLPFSVILNMVDLIRGDRKEFIQWAYHFFSPLLSSLGAPASATQGQEGGVYKHLLEMIHGNWLRNSPVSNSGVDDDKKKGPLNPKRTLIADDNKKGHLIPCASKLKEAGVKFKMTPPENNREGIFNITFKNGVISIPNVKIYDITECLLRNFIAYEQYNNKTSRPVTDYATLLDSLINSSKDVEILSKSGIMDNFLGDDEAVADLFNKIVDTVNISEKFQYVALCKEVNHHHDKRRNRWLAKLRHTHFNNPWAILSIVAAAMLLVLTAVQTVATVMSVSMSDD